MWRVIRICPRYSSAMLLVSIWKFRVGFLDFSPTLLVHLLQTQDLLGSNLTVVRCNAAKLIETTCEATAGAAD